MIKICMLILEQPHMINDTGKLHNAKTYSGLDVIYVGDGNKLSISHTLSTHGTLKLKDVVVVPKLKKNLLSVIDLHLIIIVFEFTSSGFVIKDQQQRIVVKGHRKGHLYALQEVDHEV